MEDSALREEDRDLVNGVLRGDEGAFQRLVERHHEKVFRIVRGILGDWHRSEDVCQEVFTSLYRKLRSFRHDARLSTWIYRVSVNAALKARKRWRDRGSEVLRSARRPSSKNAAGGPSFEGEEIVRKLLAPLPEKLRSAVVLKEVTGLSYHEIARVLNCSRGAVEQRLHRAMVMLREIWKGKEGSLKS